MAELAIAAGAAAIGGQVLGAGVVAMGMTGAQIGWMAGTMAASLIFRPKQPDGPRMADLSVQVSTYGNMLPISYGTVRVSGNVIWAMPVKESSHKSGGKGGGGGTTYSYSDSFAVSLGEGVVTGLIRMWFDGKLVYNNSIDNTGAVKNFEAADFRFYDGSETQLVDPTIQAEMTNAPAYRGQSYIVFTDLQLEKYGNRIPQISCEITQGPVTLAPPAVLVPHPAGSYNVQSYFAIDPKTNFVWGAGGTNSVPEAYVYVDDPASGTRITSIKLPGATQAASHPVYCPENRTFWVCEDTVFGGKTYVISADSFAVLNSFTWRCGPAGYNPERKEICGSPGYALSTGYDVVNIETYEITTFNGTTMGAWYSFFMYIPQARAIVVCNGSRLIVLEPYTYVILGNFNLGGGVGEGVSSTEVITYDSKRNRLVWMTNAATAVLTVIDLNNSMAVTTHSIANAPRSVHYYAPMDVYICSDNYSQTIHLYDPDTFATIRIISTSVGVSGNYQYWFEDAPGFDDRIYTDSSVGVKVIYLKDRADAAGVTLASIVSSVSGMVGLSGSVIDVSTLNENVMGFTISRQGSARSSIEQLMMGFQFDAVESGGKVKYVLRGGDPAKTIDLEDICAHQPGSDTPPPLSITRADEVDLPRVMTIKYIGGNSDYQVGAQSAIRQLGRAKGESSVDLPIVMTTSKARAVADAAMYSAWVGRTSVSFATSLKHANLEPTDIVVVDGATIRITEKSVADGIISFDGALESGQVFASASIAPPDPPATVVIPSVVSTFALYLDIPALTDADAANDGFYVAANGYSTGWTGASIFKSNDGGDSYDVALSVTAPVTMGSTVDALGAFTKTLFDEFNSVTVRLLSGGTLYSTTELAVLNGANVAVVGNEVIQFKTATLNADGTYTLTGLLRQRRGTSSVGHAAGDRFVLVEASTLRRYTPLVSEVGLARLYKAASAYQSLDIPTPTSFTNTGQSLETYAPVLLGGGRNAVGDVTLNWVRRTRIGGQWADLVDVPLSEVSEAYEVEFWDSGFTTLKRTLTAATPTVGYSAAQQTTDFGGNQATVHVRVYQLSATAGRGSALQGTL